jgi:Na+-translocating ferredoxin:NAD+ oxidoreductase subunit E
MNLDSAPRRGSPPDAPLGMILIGLCPSIAVAGRVIDALWMSAGVVSVLLLSRLCMAVLGRASAADPADPSAARPVGAGRWVGALVVSSFLTASFELILLSLAPAASAALGIYAPLIAVNCLVLGRGQPERDAPVWRACLAGLGQGLGFAGCLVAIALVREALGSGTITLFPAAGFSGVVAVPGLAADPARALGAAGGGLLCLGYLAAAARLAARPRAAAGGAAKDGAQ